jgi:hypothetical protein
VEEFGGFNSASSWCIMHHGFDVFARVTVLGFPKRDQFKGWI